MKKFNQYLSEDIIPLAQYQPDAVGIDNGPARDNINIHLSNVTSVPYRTPYYALDSVRRILSTFHISLPQVTFLDGEEGHEVFTINQFGAKVGMTNTGDVVTAPDSPYHVYFEWSANDHGQFDIFCEIVNDVELEDILTDIESEDEEEEMNEETINEVSQKKATDAYAAADDPDYDHPKADKILGHIRRKFGAAAEKGAEAHSQATHWGRGTPRQGSDSLSGGLRQYASDKVTKSGKIPKGTQTAMKNRMDRSKWQGHGRKVGGPKGHLPEEVLDESLKAARQHRKEAEKVGIKHPDFKKHMAAFHTAMAAHASKSNLDGGKLADEHKSSAKLYATEDTINEISSAKAHKYVNAADDSIANMSGKINDIRKTGNSLTDKTKADTIRKLRNKIGKREDSSILAQNKIRGKAKVSSKMDEEAINEISGKLANKASEKAYEKGNSYYDSTTKLRGKAFKSKDKGDMDAATAEQGKMSKKWKQSIKFKAYADKKLKEETINEISKDLVQRYMRKAGNDIDKKIGAAQGVWDKKSTKGKQSHLAKAGEGLKKASKRVASLDLATKKFKKNGGAKVPATSKYTKEESEQINEISAGKANDAYHAAADKGKTADIMAGATGKKKWQKRANKKWDQARKFADYADKKLKEETELDRWKRKYDERKKEMGHDYVNMTDKPPFDNPTEKPSTPYKNPHAKAKQLARAAMKKALEKKK